MKASQDLKWRLFDVSGNVIGYARVSTRGQSLDSQMDALVAAGAVRVFQEYAESVRVPPRHSVCAGQGHFGASDCARSFFYGPFRGLFHWSPAASSLSWIDRLVGYLFMDARSRGT